MIQKNNKIKRTIFIKHFTGSGMYWDITYPTLSWFSGEFLNNILKLNFAKVCIEDCRVPFACSALDIMHANEVFTLDGLCWRAVRGSMSLAGFVPPFPGTFDERGHATSLLVDGCYVNNFPVKMAKEMGAGFLEFRHQSVFVVKVSRA